MPDRALEEMIMYDGMANIYPTLLGAMTWTLEPGPGPLSGKLQALIEPVTELALTTVYPPTEPPPDEIDPGLPREQYKRVVVLLPPSADAEWAEAAAGAAWDEERWTVTGSADDAGIGALESKEVIVVNPEEWEGDSITWSH